MPDLDPSFEADAPSPSATPHRGLVAAALAVVVTVAVAASLYGIAGPLAWGHHGYHLGIHGSDARHFLREGRMIQGWDVGYHATPGVYYLHHPVLMHQYLGVAIAVLGDNVWAPRLVPAGFTLLLVLLAFWVGRRAFGPWAGIMAAAVFAMLPMVVAFNILPDHQQIASVYTVLGFYGYLRWLELGRRRHLALALAVFTLAAFTDWTPYLITSFLGLFALGHAAWCRRPRELLGALGLLLAFAVPLSVHLFLVRHLGLQSDMLSSLSQRTGGPDNAGMARLMAELQPLLFTKPIVWLTVIWLGTVLVRLPLRALRLWHVVPLAFLLGQGIYVFLFKQGNFVHIYRTYYMSIAYALAAADVFALLLRGLELVGARLWRPLPAALAVLLAAGLLAAEARASWPVFLESREKSGSLGHRGYAPDLERLEFGRLVNRATKPDDVVLIHPSLRQRYEFQWYLDRDVRGTSSLSDRLPPPPPGRQPIDPRRGRVLLFAGAASPQVTALLRAHPAVRYGAFVMVDFRRQGASYRAYRLVGDPLRGSLNRYLRGPHGRNWRVVRDPDEEWRAILADGLPMSADLPPPPRPRPGDRNGLVQYAQAMAALGRPEEARTARGEARATMRPLAVSLGNGLVLDGMVWKPGSPLHLLLHVEGTPRGASSLVLELVPRLAPALAPAALVPR
ncbi:MAG TPA: glycosyltransferase family 39 protein, partial [Polyangia bacterium]